MTDKWQAGKTYVPGSLVVPASAVPVVMPPLVNGDFETGDLSSWTATAQPGNWSISNFAYRGTYCLHCVGGNVATIRNDTRGQVEAGTQVSAQAVANFHNNGTDDMGCELALYWYDASDAFISQDEGASLTGKGGSYKAFSVLGYAPTNAKFVRLVIGANTGTHGGDISFDNVTWSSNYSAPPSGLVYKATQAAPGKSGTSEPSWPGVTGVPVMDNQVTWEGVIATRIVWQAIPLLKSGDTEPTWPLDVSGMVLDGTVGWQATSRRITDVNCPHSKIVAIAAGKVYAADDDIIRYCATVNPLDWSATDDAGYLPFGLQTYGSNPIAAMGLYRSNLVAFNSEGFQMWQVDPDPASITLLDALPVASTHNKALAPVANDLLFLSSLGVRSIGIAASSVNLQAGDVGMPVDVLVRESIRIATANDSPVLATYYPGAGQYWLAVRALQPLVITGGLPDGRTGETANYQYDVGGGVLPRTVSIASGALPTGLSMDASGLVTGTRTTIGSYVWTVRVVDADGSVVDLPDAAETTESLDTAIMADGPLGYWKADEASGTVMADSSGNGYHGIYNTAAGVTLGNAPLRAGGRGSLGVSVATWGARVPANAAIEIAGNGRTAWAMEVVVKKTAGLSSVFSQVFGGDGALSGDGQRIFYRWGTDRDYLIGRSYDGSTDVTSPNATTGQVVHVLFERNGASAYLYENGTLVATGPTAVSAWFGDLIFLGVSAYSSSYAIAATGSDFAIYDHALGPTRALAHAKAAGLA